jgi:glycosyltransferase involved in cell wall biosynthesis
MRVCLYGYNQENSGVSIYTRKLAESMEAEVDLETAEPPRLLKPLALNQMFLNFAKLGGIDSDILHFTNQDDLGTVYLPGNENAVVTVHDIFRYTDPRMKLDKWRGKKYMENLRRVDKIIAISEFTKEQLVENGVEEEKVEVIYQGVDSEEFRPQGEVEYGKYILHVGTEIQRKNVPGLIRIFSKLKEIDSEYTLVRVGELSEPVRKEIEEQNLELGSDVVYEKNVSFERLKALYTNTEKLANPSLREGFGRTMIESLLCETPVVAYDRKPMNEVLPDEMLVGFKDEDAFARKLLEEHKGETRELAETFSWQKTAEKTAEVYREMEE